jgi:hypothetical protein
MIINGDGMLDSKYIKDVLVYKKPCKGVFHSSPGCTDGRHVNNHTLESMLIGNEDFSPENIQLEIENSLITFLKDTNISCSTEFSEFNTSNIPEFQYKSSLPATIPLNTPYGNGTYRQTGDGITTRIKCPDLSEPPPDGRNDFLSMNYAYSIGDLHNGINPVCSVPDYEYLAIDRTLSFDLLVRCQDTTLGDIIDGRYGFSPLTLEFIIRIDMMSDCPLPDNVPAITIC